MDGKDEVYLKVNGRKVVGDVSLRNGHTYHTVDNHGDYLHFPIEESGRLKIQLYEADPSPNSDDLLGKWDEWDPQKGGYGRRFRKNDSKYILFFSIENDANPAALEIVIPSLGNPLILEPRALHSPLEIRLSTRSALGDIQEAIRSAHTSCVLRDAATGDEWNCLLAIKNREEIAQRKETFNKIRLELNENRGKFPRSNDAFLAGCGIITDFAARIKVIGIGKTLTEGLPRIFDIVLGDHAAKHAVYVSDVLPKKDDITLLQVSDTHVSIGFDGIADFIGKVPGLASHERSLIASRYRNPNKNLRSVIEYANSNDIDAIVVTGDIVNWASDGWFQVKGRAQTNYAKFIDIVTNNDGRGEPLKKPLFVVPGNHEFYPFGIPLKFRTDIYGITNHQVTAEIDAINLTEFSQQLHSLEDGQRFSNNFVDEHRAFALIVNTYPQFYPFLMSISYSLSYATRIGRHHIVALNSGQDIGRPANPNQLLSGVLLGSRNDYLKGGSHCQGFSNEDQRLLESVLALPSAREGMIVLLSHAPLINIEYNPQEETLEPICEHRHASFPSLPGDTEITRFWAARDPDALVIDDGGSEDGSAPSIPSYHERLTARGFPQGQTRHCYSLRQDADRPDYLIDYGCADGGSFMQILKAISLNDAHNVVVLSGHTHHIAEYRATADEREIRIHVENYSGSGTWTKLPNGHQEDQLPSNQNTPAKWTRDHTPLFLISGSLKGKKRGEFRIIKLQASKDGNPPAITSMQMVKLS